MIAPLKARSTSYCIDCGQERFLELLPKIRQQARVAFRGLGCEARDEIVQEVTANAYSAFVQLVRRGKVDLAYATPLAQFAIRQVRCGRRVGSQLNKHDITSVYSRRIHRLTIEHLDQRDPANGCWQEILVEDRHSGPAETAAARLDIAAWLRSLSPRYRKIARLLATGETTGAAARRFSLTPGRVSQLRTWFREQWESFQGTSRTATPAV